jgi:protoporphyrinogen oxidase
MSKNKVIILGGGLSGLSAAWHLQKKGVSCAVYEKEAQAGGLCRSKNVNGFTFDYDGHLLHFRHKDGFEFVRRLLGKQLNVHDRSSYVYTRSRYIRYPFQANLFGLPSSVKRECLSDFIRAQNENHREQDEDTDFLGWMNRSFGSGIARHFMIPYNRKFWTVPPQRLTCEWLDGFVPVPSLGQVMEGAREESKRQLGYNARFWYPKIGGIQVIAKAISSELKELYALHEASTIDLKNKKIRFSNGISQEYDKLILTLPLPEILKLIKHLPPGIANNLTKLRYTSIYNLNLGIDRTPLSDKHWIYYPEKKFIFFRVGFPGNFAPQSVPSGTSSLYAEVAYSNGGHPDKGFLCRDIMRDLRRAGVLRREDKILAQDTNDIQYGYVIYDKERKDALRRVTQFLEKNNIFCLGRYGSWSYMSMEDCLLGGKKMADMLSL